MKYKNEIILIIGLHGCEKTTQIKLPKKYFQEIGEDIYTSKADKEINFKKI